MAMTRVFVYGTLKRGLPNYYLLTEPSKYGVARFVGEARLEKKYPLVVYCRYNVPCLLSDEGKGKNVSGEVYDVDPKMLVRLDKLEDHPGLYTRTSVTCILEQPASQDTEVGSVLNCEVYMVHNFNKDMLSRPFLSDYDIDVHKATPYSPRQDRASGYDVYQELKEQ